MTDVRVILPSHDDYERLLEWFQEHGVVLYGASANRQNFEGGDHWAVVTLSTTRFGDPRQWLCISLSDDLEDLALLLKLTWGGR